MPLSYQDLSDLYRNARLGSPEAFQNVSLPKFAQTLNEATGSQEFSAGLHDNWIKQVSAGINRTLDATGIPQALGDTFSDLGQSFGAKPETGFNVGHGLLRGAVNFAPLLIAGGLAPETLGGSLLGYGALASTAGLTAADTYTETDSPLQAAISGISTAALPELSEFGGGVGLGLLTKSATKGFDPEAAALIRERVERSLGGKLASYAGGQVAAAGDFEAARQASSVASGQGLQNPLTPDNIFSTVASQLPWMVADLPRMLRETPAATEVRTSVQTSQKIADANTGISSIPDLPPTEIKDDATREKFGKFNQIVADKAKIAADETLPPDVKQSKLADLELEENKVVQSNAKQTPEEQATTLFDEPVVTEPEMVRLYHGSAQVNAPGRDFTTLLSYAQGYADKAASGPGKVWAVDVPKGQLKTHDEYGQPMTRVVVPDDIANQATVVEDRSQHSTEPTSNPDLTGQPPSQPPIEPGIAGAIKEIQRRNAPAEQGQHVFQVKPGQVSDGWLGEALAERRQKGWDDKWPFIPADLANQSFVDAIKSDPGITPEDKVRILSFAPGGKNEIKLVAQPTVPVEPEVTANQAKANSIAPAPDLPSAVNKVKTADDINTQVGGTKLTNKELGDRIDTLVGFGHDLTESTDQTVQAVATDAADRAAVGNKVTKREANKQKKQQDAMAFMADQEKAGGPTWEKEQPIIQRWLEKASEQSGGQVERFTHDAASAYQNWVAKGRPNGAAGLNGTFSKTLRNALKGEFETYTLKQNGQMTKADNDESRMYFNNSKDAYTKKDELFKEHLASLGAKPLNSEFAVRRYKNKINPNVRYFIDQRIYHNTEPLIGENAGVDTTSKLDENRPVNQADADTHEAVVDKAPMLFHDAESPDADPETKVAATVVRATTDDIATTIKFLHDDTIQDALGFGTKDKPTGPADIQLFRDRAIEVVKNSGKDMGLINDLMNEKGLGFKTEQELADFVDSPELSTILGSARDALYEQQNPDVSLDAVGLKGEQTKLPPQIVEAKPYGLMGGLSSLADRWFKSLGYTDTTLQGYKEAFLKLGALFPQLEDSRVGELVDDKDTGIAGLSISAPDDRTDFPGAMLLTKLKALDIPKQTEYLRRFVVGHEMWHTLENQHLLGHLSPEHTQIMNRLMDHLNDATPDDRRVILTEFINQVLPKWADSSEIRGFILNGVDSPTETRAHMGGMLAATLTSPSRNIRAMVEFMPKPVGDFIDATFRWMKTVWSGIAGQNELANRGLIDSVGQSDFSPFVKDFTKDFLSLTRDLNDVKAITSKFMELSNIDPVGYRAMQKDYELNPLHTSSLTLTKKHQATIGHDTGYLMGVAGDKAKTEEFLEKEKSGFAGMWEEFKRAVVPALQYAEANPIIKPAVWLPMDYQRLGHEFMQRSLTPFSGYWNPETGGIEFGEKMEYLKRLQTDTKARDTLNQIQLWQNDEGKAFVKDDGKSFEKPELVADLTPQQLRDVVSANLSIRASNEVNQQAYLRSKKAELSTMMATTVQGQNPSWKPQQSESVAQTMLTATEMMRDPATIPQAQAFFTQLQAKLTPEAFLSLQGFAQEGLKAHDDLATFYAKNPQYTSERRFGKFAISYIDNNNKRGRVSGDSQADVERLLGQVDGGVKQVLQRVTPDTIKRTAGLSQDFITAAQNYEAVVKTQMQHILGDEEFDKIKQISFSDPLVRELAAQKLGERTPNRRGASGRETLDMLENHLAYTNALTRSMGVRFMRNKMALVLKDPELTGRDDLKSYAVQHMENFLVPDSPAGRALSATNFMYYMGMNISTTMMESVQSAFSLVPTLVRNGSGIIDAYRRTFSASKEIGHWATTGSWNNPEHAQVMDRAGKEFDIQLGSYSETLDPEDHGVINIRRLMQQKDPASMSDLVTKPIGQFSQLARNYYSIFTNFNHRMALISAFDHFRDQGMPFDAAYDKASEINHLVNFSGGRAARPVGLFGMTGQIGRTASQALYSLQSYQAGMIAMMGRYLKESFGSLRPDLSQDQRTSARKAAVLMLGTQLAAAGALGMPGVGASIAVLEQLFPNLQLNKKLRTTLASLAGDNQEQGAILSDMALHGIPNQIGGIDLGSRFALGNILGTNNYDGFSVDNFIGPTGSILKNMAMGIQQASNGDLGRAASSILPQAFKKIIDTVRNDGQIRDQKGSLLLTPTAGEKFAMMVGFQPDRVRTIRDAQRMMQRSQEIDRNDTIRFHQDLADEVQQGNFQDARQSLLDKAKTDPTYNPRDGAREIAQIIANRTLPIDLRRLGSRQSADDDAAIRRTYAITGPPPSDQQRLQIQQQILNRLGIVGATVTPNQVRSAILTDQIGNQHPDLQRSAVSAAVSRLLHPAQQPTF